MKDYDELVSRFDSIQDLPISEEQLGAYLEGNLNLYEMEELGHIVKQDPMLQSIVEDALISPLTYVENSAEYVDNPLNNDFSGHEPQDDNLVFFDSEVHSDINIEEPLFNIDSNGFDCDTLIDDTTFELPDLPFI